MNFQLRTSRELHSVFDIFNKNQTRTTCEFDLTYKDWSEKEKSLFIETILMGIKVPCFFVKQNPNGSREIIDGKKRYKAIQDFYSDKFKLDGLAILENLNGLSFKDLNPVYQNAFEDFVLDIYVFLPPYDIDTLKDIIKRFQ